MRITIFFKKNYFIIATIGIAILAAVLRFYEYPNRWGLAYDQAHDAIIARYALSHLRLPLLGPFSSAGAFQTGGEWYWFIMLGIILFPFTLLGPWIFLTLVQLGFVVGLIYLGRKIINNKFGLIVGLLAALSPVEISQSTNLTNQSIENVCCLLAIISITLYLQKKRAFWMFFLGFSTSLAISIHLQGVGLIYLLVSAVIIAPILKKHIPFLFLGLFLPAFPLLLSDLQNNFFTVRNMLQYFLHDQYKIPLDQLGRRWLSYIGLFWPKSLSNILGGNILYGYGFFVVMIIGVLISLMQRKMPKVIFIAYCSFAISILVLRYLHTPIFDSYLMFLHPAIFLITGWGIYSIFRFNKIIGIIILAFIIFGSLQKNIQDIVSIKENTTPLRSAYWSNFLNKNYPGKRFLIYDYLNKSYQFSTPLVMYLDYYNLSSDSGYRIGFGNPSQKDDPIRAGTYRILEGNKMGFVFVDIGATPSGELKKAKWYPVSPSYIYNSTENWYKNK